jgi:hypothetical protein
MTLSPTLVLLMNEQSVAIEHDFEHVEQRFLNRLDVDGSEQMASKQRLRVTSGRTNT